MRQYRSACKSKKRGTKQAGNRNARPLGGVRLRSLIYEILEDRRLLSLSDMPLSQAQQTALSNGLQGLATWSSSLGQFGPLAQQLPLVDQTIGSALNISGLLQNQLVAPSQSALASASDSNAVVSALQQLNYSANGLAVTVASASVSGGEVTPQANELQFNLVFDATRTTTTALDLGSNATIYGLSFPGSANVQLTTTLAFNLTFGLELQSDLAPADAFFMRLQQPDGGGVGTTGQSQLQRSGRYSWRRCSERVSRPQCGPGCDLQSAGHQCEQQHHPH